VTAARGLPCVLVSGAPASGKTVLGRALARRLAAALLDLDVATTAMTAVVADQVGQRDLDSPALAEATRAARYETLTALAEDNLRVGRPAVLVAPFTAERRDPAAWAALSARLTAAGGAPALVWLRAGPDLLLDRLRFRAAERDRSKLLDPARFLDGVPLGAPAIAHLAVDASLDADRQCAEVLAALPGAPVT
jgi:predicted kinase